MPEGLLTAGGAVAAGVHDDPESPPPASKDAPRGHTWDRKNRSWKPKQRGPVIWKGDDDAAHGPATGDGSPGDGSPADADATQGAGRASDPDPSWLRDDTPGGNGNGDGKKRFRFEDVPKRVKDDIAGTAGMLGLPVLETLRRLDPYCGSAFADNFEPIVDACLPLICRSEKVVKWFSGDKSDGLLGWLGLGMALRPVAAAIIEHHVTRTVQVVYDEHGRPHAVRVQPGQQGSTDSMQPPAQPEYSYQA